MPWHMERRGDKVVVVKDSDGKVVGTHSDRRKAIAQLRALYASESINKASFSSRSEAGRYAANIRWMGHIPENIKLRFRAVKPKTKSNSHLIDSINAETQQILDKGYGGGDDPSVAWKEVVMEQIVASLEMTDPRDGHLLQLLEQLKTFSPLETYGDTPIKQLVSGVINNWAVTSNDNNPVSLAIQNIARVLFGLSEADVWDFSDVVDPTVKAGTIRQRDQLLNDPEIKTFISDVLKAQYQLTQKYFAEKGITEIEVFRGVELPSESADVSHHISDALVNASLEEKRQVLEILKGGTYRAKASTRPLSAWAITRGIAEDFTGRNGVLMRTKIPVKDIFSTPQTGFGCWLETEIVTLGTGSRDVDYAFPSWQSRPQSPTRLDFDFTNEYEIKRLARIIYDDMKASK